MSCLNSTSSSTQTNASAWQTAFDRLSDDMKASLRPSQNAASRKIDILAMIQETAEEQRLECIRKRWKFKKPNGEVVVLRDVMDKMIRWLSKFREIGDIAVQFNPFHAALPWAGVRFLLQALVNDVEIFKVVAESLETVSRLITKHAILESIYLSGSSAATRELEVALTDLYTEILMFQAKALKYLKTPKPSKYSTYISVQGSATLCYF